MAPKNNVFMARAIQLAQVHNTAIRTNPRVGAVIVYDNKIIGEGAHQKFGEAHAEINAINSVTARDKHLLPQATIYVTLEPCSHQGKTPPCSLEIVRHRFKKVVVATLDPSSKENGRGIEIIKAAGIDVELGEMEDEARELTAAFRILAFKKRPKIILKFAVSADGYIGKNDAPVWLSSPISKRWVHQLRSKVGAIMVGKNTVNIDDPKLNTRFGFGDSPLRIIPDRASNLSVNLSVLADNNPTLILTSKAKSNPKGLDFNKEFQIIDFDDFYTELIHILNKKKIKTILVEGGAKMLQGFIDEGLWDEAYIFRVGKKLETGISAPTLSSAELVLRTSIRTDILERWIPLKT